MKVTWSDVVAALKSGAWVSWVGTVVIAAGMFGLLDSQQATEINNIAAAVATVIAAIMAFIHTRNVAKKVAQVRRLSLPPRNATAGL